MANVLVPLAHGCEELEAITIIDLLRRAGIKVVTASLTDEPVKCSRQTVIVADTTLDQVMQDDFDLIVLPGGLPGADNLNADPRIHDLLSRLTQQGKMAAAICAAPRVLLDNGLLKGKKATAYPGSLAKHDTSDIDLQNTAVEIADNVVTSRGPGTAMDFSLTLIELLQGKESRDAVEQGLVR